jgi:hypothetical protein
MRDNRGFNRGFVSGDDFDRRKFVTVRLCRLSDTGTVLFQAQDNEYHGIWIVNKKVVASPGMKISGKTLKEFSDPLIAADGSIVFHAWLFKSSVPSKTGIPDSEAIILDDNIMFETGQSYAGGVIIGIGQPRLTNNRQYAFSFIVRDAEGASHEFGIISGKAVDMATYASALSAPTWVEEAIKTRFTYGIVYNANKMLIGPLAGHNELHRIDGALFPGLIHSLFGHTNPVMMNEKGQIFTDNFCLFNYSDAIKGELSKNEILNFEKKAHLYIPFGSLLGLGPHSHGIMSVNRYDRYSSLLTDQEIMRFEESRVHSEEVAINNNGQIAFNVYFVPQGANTTGTAIILGTPVGQQPVKEADDLFSKVLTDGFTDDAGIKKPTGGN